MYFTGKARLTDQARTKGDAISVLLLMVVSKKPKNATVNSMLCVCPHNQLIVSRSRPVALYYCFQQKSSINVDDCYDDSRECRRAIRTSLFITSLV